MNLQLISTSATQPNTGAAGAALVGDSLTMPNARGAKIISGWSTNQVAGHSQISFPSGHDTTRGIRVGVSVGKNLGVIPMGQHARVEAQELVSINIAGSNVGGDVEQLTLLLHNDDLPGISQRLITAGQLESRFEMLTTIEHSAVSTAGPSTGRPSPSRKIPTCC